MRSLRYSQAELLRGRVADLLQELSAFVDAEEDAIEDGAENDPGYIDALADACLALDSACISLERIGENAGRPHGFQP